MKRHSKQLAVVESDADAHEPDDQKASQRPIVQLGDLPSNCDAAEQILLDGDVPIYQHAGGLVRPVVEVATAAHGHTTKIARLQKIDATYLRDLLGRHADWQAFNVRDKKWVKKDPVPMEIATTILARVGEWRFPSIAGIITTPTIRPDGSLLVAPGYDPVTRLLLIEPPAMPAVPDLPTRDDALKSLALLENLLAEFPFSNDVSRAVALSALVTPIVRGAFTVAPMHACSAPAAGSGKSYMADVAASIAIGQLMPVMAAGRTEEETEKRLGAALMTGQPLISIDNVTNGLGGDALCVVIERGSVVVRVLGRSEQVRIEARGTTFFASGNNLVIIGDACRRIITTTLNPGIERPELREFRSNPVAKVMADRGAYIAAALTICRAYIVAGRPNPAKRLASFEGWSNDVRSALIWLGKADPVASMETARAQDPERNELLAMLEAWADAIGVGPQSRCTLGEVIKTAERTLPGSAITEHPDLYDAIQASAGRKQKADAGSLGRWMQRRADTVVEHMRFVVSAKGKGGSQWWIERTD